MCLFFCQAIAGCNYLLGLAYVGFCYYPSWILLFTGMVIPRASDLGSKLHCARYYADLVYYRRVFTVLGMYGLTLWYQEGTEQGNRKTFTCNIISNGQCTPAVLFWNGKGLCLKKKKCLENVIFLRRTVIIKVFSFLLPLRNTRSAFSVQNGFCYYFWDYSQLHPSVDTRGFF